MSDELEDGNDSPLEGAEELFSVIDEAFGGTADAPPQDTPRQADPEPEPLAEEKDVPHGTDALSQLESKPAVAKVVESVKTEQQKPAEYPEGIKTEKARENYRALELKKSEAEKRAADYESKLKAYQAKEKEWTSKSGLHAPEVKVLQEENAKLKTQLEERERILSFKAIEETVAFKENVTAPRTEALETLNQVAATYELDIATLDKILAEPNKFKRMDLLGELTEDMPERAAFAKTELKDAVEKFVVAESKRGELLKKAEGSREYATREQEEAKAREALARQSEFKSAGEEVTRIVKEKFPEFAQDEAVWSDITSKAAQVVDFDSLPAKAKAYANLASFAMLKSSELIRARDAKIAELERTLAARTKAMPGAGRAAATERVADEDQDLISFLDTALA